MNRVDRLFGILVLLQSKQYVTADKIAEKFDISVRTVYRDIKALYELGIPVSFEQPKGYYIVQGYFLPPVSFTSEEANALLFMEYLVTGFADRSIAGHYSGALHKIKAVLRHSQKEKLEKLHDSMRMQLPECSNQDYAYLSVIQNAIAVGTTIEVEYKNNKEESSKRKLEPIGLIFYAFNWHVIAWCRLRNEYRDFRVSRILKIKDLGTLFQKTDHIALQDYMKNIPVDY